ncbi:MAG TPA: hypothetical protein DDX98_12165 [Bacteroidales bacterium]|nr:hypothetical protein [Bacteroidales bacterium]
MKFPPNAPSPEPAYKTLGFVTDCEIVTIDKFGKSGLTFFHSPPALIVFQIPPPAVPINHVLFNESEASTTIVLVLPATFAGPLSTQFKFSFLTLRLDVLTFLNSL